MKNLNWRELEKRYSGQWVELSDCQWDSDQHLPKSATVRKAAPHRSALVSEMKRDSVILFVAEARPIMNIASEGVAA